MISFPSTVRGPGLSAMPFFGHGPRRRRHSEWWGLVLTSRTSVTGSPAAGFVALAPDLYRGTRSLSRRGRQENDALQLDGAAKTCQSGRRGQAAVGERQGRCRGFCMGGGLALCSPPSVPTPWRHACRLYGLIPWPDAQPDFSKLSGTVLVHVAGNDEYFTPAAAQALQEQFAHAGQGSRIPRLRRR